LSAEDYLGPWWIAATDLSEKGNFKWCYQGKEIPFNTTKNVLVFDFEQPDYSDEETCLVFYAQKDYPLALNERPCKEHRRFICKVIGLSKNVDFGLIFEAKKSIKSIKNTYWLPNVKGARL